MTVLSRSPTDISLEKRAMDILARFEVAKAARSSWESLWRDCYDYTLPAYGGFCGAASRPDRKSERLFDGTAPDAVDQLSSTLLGHLVPLQGPWFNLRPGPDVQPDEADDLSPRLGRISDIVAQHLRRSNIQVELHQCLLDLVIGGTACLLFEEAPVGEETAFRFKAIPLADCILADSGTGQLDTLYRPIQLTTLQIATRYGDEAVAILSQNGKVAPADSHKLLEAIEPYPRGGVNVSVMALDIAGGTLLQYRTLPNSPLIAMRWMKSPGEDYGRSPVMKALPDIKTANRVVELTLKNASIAVAGIWQADDDGVLNPANITLSPGTIIPKAVGSKGLTPLEMPSKFDVSQLVLEDLRKRIRHALIVDRLPQANMRAMTATEVMERVAEMALVLSGAYARLQSELLYPLLLRAFSILSRRGEIPELPLDSRFLVLDILSPLVRAATQRDAQNVMDWLQLVQRLGPVAAQSLNIQEIVKSLGQIMGIPAAYYTTVIPEGLTTLLNTATLNPTSNPTSNQGENVNVL
ncbi:MAG: portal protein [Pseudomonadota bacterium]